MRNICPYGCTDNDCPLTLNDMIKKNPTTMTLQDLERIGKLMEHAGYNPHRITLFMSEGSYKKEFEGIKGIDPIVSVKQYPRSLYAGVPALCQIQYGGYTFFVIDPKEIK